MQKEHKGLEEKLNWRLFCRREKMGHVFREKENVACFTAEKWHIVLWGKKMGHKKMGHIF